MFVVVILILLADYTTYLKPATTYHMSHPVSCRNTTSPSFPPLHLSNLMHGSLFGL